MLPKSYRQLLYRRAWRGTQSENRCQMSDHRYIQTLHLEGYTIDTIITHPIPPEASKRGTPKLKLGELPRVDAYRSNAPPTSGNICIRWKRVRFMLSDDYFLYSFLTNPLGKTEYSNKQAQNTHVEHAQALSTAWAASCCCHVEIGNDPESGKRGTEAQAIGKMTTLRWKFGTGKIPHSSGQTHRGMGQTSNIRHVVVVGKSL